MEVINSGMRKGIKAMAVIAQTAQFVSLMPKPMDFVTRIVGDVVYLSSQLKKLSDDMDKLLESYIDIPTNYLMTQMNSITGSLSSIVDRLNVYGQNAVNQTMGIGENAVNMVTELTGSAIDTTGALTTAIVGLAGAVAESSVNILGQTDTGEDIHDATEVILEWTGDGFKTINENTTAPLRKAQQTITDKKTQINDKINNAAETVNDKIEQSRLWVESLLNELREKMRKLSDTLDYGFKEVTGMSSVSKGADVIANGLNPDSPAAVATVAASSAISTVIKNFSIGKMVFAFAGVLTQTTIVKLGLDKLPPIDFESMLCKIRDDKELSTEDMYKQYNHMLESTYNDYIQFNEEAAKAGSDERNYSSKNYKEFMKAYNEDLKKKRDEIRLLMKTSKTSRGEVLKDEEINKEIKSAIKELRKYRQQVKNARQSNTIKSILGDELIRFKNEVQYRCNTIKADWNDMMQQYKNAIAEIKGYFSNGGCCDMYIEDCCKAINHDCDEIKSLCKSLITQLAGSAVKIVMPADIGTVVPNPIYKIADFIMDIKTILKFIKDLLTLILDIINNINKLARIILNGINNLNEIIKQLMDIIGLKWLMDLVQNIITLFWGNITDARTKLENTLSPVYFSDTIEYSNAMDALDELLEETGLSEEGKGYLADVTGILENVGKEKDIKSLVKDINSIRKMKRATSDSQEEQVSDVIDDLEKQGELIVAYKSPIIQDTGEEKDVSGLLEGEVMENDIKFIGWHFFHPNLNHTGSTYYSSKFMKRVKSKIIKKASKTGHKKNGGVARLRIKNVGRKSKRIDKAYVAFYWYTYYTEDMERDCFDMMTEDKQIIVDSVMRTENGSVVEIDINGQSRKVFVADANVRQGDYVTVDGVKYRVK